MDGPVRVGVAEGTSEENHRVGGFDHVEVVVAVAWDSHCGDGDGGFGKVVRW
jgi:hypothetical protein